ALSRALPAADLVRCAARQPRYRDLGRGGAGAALPAHAGYAEPPHHRPAPARRRRHAAADVGIQFHDRAVRACAHRTLGHRHARQAGRNARPDRDDPGDSDRRAGSCPHHRPGGSRAGADDAAHRRPGGGGAAAGAAARPASAEAAEGGATRRLKPRRRRPRERDDSAQNSPTIRPSTPTSIESAAGTRGSPGMVMISPQTTTTNTAPAESLTSRTLIVWSTGAPLVSALVEKLYWVLAMQTGSLP